MCLTCNLVHSLLLGSVLQNGFSGDSFGGSPHICFTTGLHYCRGLRSSQITQCVSTRLLCHDTNCRVKTCSYICLNFCYKYLYLAGHVPCFVRKVIASFFNFSETLIMWFCASWPLMMKMWKMWPCRSTLHSFRLSAVRMTSTSWESTTPGVWQKYWVEVENRVGVNLWTCTVCLSLYVSVHGNLLLFLD